MSAPARILGLGNRGELGPGAAADIAVYQPDADRERMFGAPRHVFKAGIEVVRDGAVLAAPAGATHVVRPAFDHAIEGEIRRFFDDHMSVGLDHFRLGEGELADAGIRLVAEACRPRTRA